ncbi:MAG: hypothetical protein LKI22_00195 [Liquorilactobacillus nagelii]|jgi:uncharacterized protein YdcH (DUF465 family)|uniref:hypothetical protein n=1 Tax=Liquorilactobacillus nagelii TaxID=82688 RepID=UPI00243122C9|nr:hypothetical protein [Liquorilactobacillus nagelii]MCI1632384.1 hypothetical protein [Liquorilactobacillus nagelii]
MKKVKIGGKVIMDNYSKVYQNEKINKISIKLIGQRKGKLYSSQEVGKLNMDIGNAYYKSEVLKSIEALLFENIDPKYIFVLDNSVSNNIQYIRIEKGTLNLKADELVDFYNLGEPTGLWPSRRMYLLNIFFKIYRKIYTLLNANRHEKLSITYPAKKDTLNKVYNLIESDKNYSLKTVLEKQVDNANFYLKDNPGYVSIRNKAFDRIEKEIKLFNRYYNMDEKTFNNTVEVESHERQFKTIFDKRTRPIVGYIDSDETVHILGYKLIARKYFTHENPRFHEINYLKQESPLCFVIATSIAFAPQILRFINAELNIIKNKKEEKQESQDKLSQIKANDERISKLRDEIEEMDNKIKKLNSAKPSTKIIKEAESVNGQVNPRNNTINNREALNAIKYLENSSYKKMEKYLQQGDIRIESIEEKN